MYIHVIMLAKIVLFQLIWVAPTFRVFQSPFQLASDQLIHIDRGGHTLRSFVKNCLPEVESKVNSPKHPACPLELNPFKDHMNTCTFQKQATTKAVWGIFITNNIITIWNDLM